MFVKKLALKNFRNIEPCTIEPSEQVTILCGDNGQGKTNLLEAVYFFSAGKSFRAGRDKDFIRFGENEAKLKMDFISGGTSKTCEIELFSEGRKRITAGGSRITSRSELMGVFTAILFAPEHLELVKAGPSERRRFLDFAISSINPRYCRAIAEAGRVVLQKNALLKEARKNHQAMATLPVWNDKLAAAGAYITSIRFEYIRQLQSKAERHLNKLSSGGEQLHLKHLSAQGLDTGLSQAQILQFYNELLPRLCEAEIAAGCCLAGPHREDMEIEINEKPARVFASQGQQRSAVLSLKLAEGELSQDAFGEPPVYLLDDIMSELDKKRQGYITEAIKDRQVILTTCGNGFLESSAKKLFIEGGKIKT